MRLNSDQIYGELRNRYQIDYIHEASYTLSDHVSVSTLALLSPIMFCLMNSVDPDHLASDLDLQFLNEATHLDLHSLA